MAADGAGKGAEQVPGDLVGAVAEAKGPDPLAPVTVVTASGYASVFVRRALAVCEQRGGQVGVANLNATTFPALVKSLGTPHLASRGLRPASSGLYLEALRTEALAAGGWLARFAGHPRALGALERAVSELRHCPPAVLSTLSSGRAQTDALVCLMRAVRRRLHDRGFADDLDLFSAASQSLRATKREPDLGPVLTWHLGRLSQVEAEVLRILRGTRVEEKEARGDRTTFCEIRPCADPDEEARAAVRAVLEGAETGVALWRQAIFHPPRAGYAQLIHRQLSSAAVAANGPGLRSLDRCAAARTLLALLDLAGGDWNREQVVALMACAPVVAPPAGRPVPASRWDDLSAAAGVIRGVEQWRERLGHYAALHGDAAVEAEALSEFVSSLAARTVPPSGSWAAYARWAARLLDAYLDPGSSTDPWPAAEVAAASQVHAVLDSLAQLDHVSEGVDLASFRFALQAQLERQVLDDRQPGAGGFGDGVFVAPFASARGLGFEDIVVCGLADAVVPGLGGIDSLLDDEVRQSDTSGTLRTRSSRRDEMREDVLAAMGSGAARRIATLPRCDPRTGRSHQPSRWLRDMAPSGTPWRAVDSFSAGISGGGPALSGAEFELRALDRWIGCGGDPAHSPVAGADRRLAAGLEAIRARAASHFTRFDGSAETGAVSPFDPETPVSATRFETYARCPRRYLFERVLRLSKRLLPEELWQIEPVDRGSLVHAILEEYVAERVAGAERSIDRLLSIAERHLDETEAGGLVGKRLLWQMDREAILRELRRFHREEGDLEPLSVELTFGSDDGDRSPPVVVGLEDGREVRFRGSADRVDRSRRGHLVVSDYKTGKQLGLGALVKDPVASGTLLQLPLYAMAARERFGDGTGGPAHARYWLLSSERSAPCYHLVVTDAVQKRFRQVIGRIAMGVETGCFPGVPGAPLFDGHFENCRTCDFDRVCPPDRDRQWNRKAGDPKLAPVVALLKDDVDESLSGAVVKGFVDPDEESP